MPTDSVKRKQLELKIAAAARQHAQKRRQERDYGIRISAHSEGVDRPDAEPCYAGVNMEQLY